MGRTPWGPESAYAAPGLYDATKASRWGWLNFDWSDGSAMWQDKLPGHNDEAVMVEQCKRIKALGTGTRCFVYRNTELALQWEETSRAAMTQRNVDAGWFLRYKTKAGCDASVPCNVAAYHNANQLPLIPCNNKKPINISAPNCGNCCNFTGSNGTGASHHLERGDRVAPVERAAIDDHDGDLAEARARGAVGAELAEAQPALEARRVVDLQLAERRAAVLVEQPQRVAVHALNDFVGLH